MKTNRDIFAHCDSCGKPLYYGNACVTINHNIEQVDWDEQLEDAMVTVIQSEPLITLCALCGQQLDIQALGLQIPSHPHEDPPGEPDEEDAE